MNDDRTATVDETIDLAFEQGNTGGISNLVVAESAAGRPSEYSILKESLVVGQETIPILVKPTSRGSIVASVPASALQNVTSAQLHVAYRVKGAFVDRIGGDLGARSTFTWDVIPATWPTDIASSSIELENAPGIAPLYIGGSRLVQVSLIGVAVHFRSCRRRFRHRLTKCARQKEILHTRCSLLAPCNAFNRQWRFS